jgi:ribosomal protein S18 acetylase RimI-like enzyme
MDAARLGPLVAEAGGALHEHVLSLGHHRPEAYVTAALAEPGGVIGYRHLRVVEVSGVVVGCLAVYPARARMRMFAETAWKLLRFYGLYYTAVFAVRSMRMLPMTATPPSSALCIAHCAIAPEVRGQGLFRRALETALSELTEGADQACLEVAETNVGAIGVYQALGFRTTERKPSVVPGLPGVLQMSRAL